MRHLILFGVDGVTGRRGRSGWTICACLLISLLATGCATTIASYKVDKIEKPEMNFSEAIQTFHSLNKRGKGMPGRITSERLIVLGNIYLPLSGHAVDGGWEYKFKDVKQLDFIEYGRYTYLTYEGSLAYGGLCLNTQDDAKRFADTFMALKYYMSYSFVADDAVAFNDFREKAKVWRALPVKPVLPAVTQQFEFIDEAAEFYEHRLAVEPLWPQGQFNAAMYEGKWGWYGMAASHMKRYLELVPDAKNAEFAGKMVRLWEEMAKANTQGRARLAQQMSAEIKRQEETEFGEKAMAWRALPVKPALPEDVQRFRVAAEDAFKNKDFKKAAEYYGKGLAVEPLWPQGQFNAALLYGELQSYEQAASHMKRYLALVPDAENTKAAREKMLLWEVKAKETPSPESIQKAPETLSPPSTKKVKKAR